MWIIILLVLSIANWLIAYKLGKVRYQMKQIRILRGMLDEEKTNLDKIRSDGKEKDPEAIHRHMMGMYDSISMDTDVATLRAKYDAELRTAAEVNNKE